MRQLSASTWVIEGPTNIGVIESNANVILIDSGNDKESGRKINRILREKNWRLRTVINTHSNADHIGGNDYLQRNLGCEIHAPSMEQAFIESPELETAFLWGGLEIKDLRNKFFQAKPSRVTRILEPDDDLENGLRTIGLAGHFFNMIGIESPDQVLFIADSLFGEDILKKYKIPFIYDVCAYKETIGMLKTYQALYYVPSHGIIETDITSLADKNLDVVHRIEETVLKIVTAATGFDAILQGVCNSFDIELNAGQYALVGSTIRSFLSYLYDEEKIGYRFVDNVMVWECTGR